jgi:hypothetical protein
MVDRRLSPVIWEKNVRDIGIQYEIEFDDAACSAWEKSERVEYVEVEAEKPETRNFRTSICSS